MIQLFHVSKHYDRRTALSDITLDIEKGEFILLMGASGAGKSTLLRLLIGAEQPDEVQIFVQGRNVSKLSPPEIPYLRRKVGIVFQDFRQCVFTPVGARGHSRRHSSKSPGGAEGGGARS